MMMRLRCHPVNDKEDGMATLHVKVGMLTVLLAGFVAQSVRAQTAAPAPEIVKVADAYVKAALANDAKAVAALYTDDAVEMPPFQPMVKGKANIEQYYVKQFSGPVKVKSFSLTHLDTKASGEVGYDVGTYAQTMSGGEHPVDAGKYVVILRRSGNEWKVAYAIYNSDQAPAPPAGAAPPK
jgi:uncharacterized protein (TIGR02246 family)